jgi:hypothetical protein
MYIIGKSFTFVPRVALYLDAKAVVALTYLAVLTRDAGGPPHGHDIRSCGPELSMHNRHPCRVDRILGPPSRVVLVFLFFLTAAQKVSGTQGSQGGAILLLSARAS